MPFSASWPRLPPEESLDMISPKVNRIETGSPELIARCGMNCGLCHAFIREKNTCPGCRSGGEFIFKSVVACRIRTCDRIAASGAEYCYDCGSFPCASLKHLDKRYRTRYGMSMLENLGSIRRDGIEVFLRNETQRWKCPGCGETICVHKPQCLACGNEWH